MVSSKCGFYRGDEVRIRTIRHLLHRIVMCDEKLSPGTVVMTQADICHLDHPTRVELMPVSEPMRYAKSIFFNLERVDNLDSVPDCKDPEFFRTFLQPHLEETYRPITIGEKFVFRKRDNPDAAVVMRVCNIDPLPAALVAPDTMIHSHFHSTVRLPKPKKAYVIIEVICCRDLLVSVTQKEKL